MLKERKLFIETGEMSREIMQQPMSCVAWQSTKSVISLIIGWPIDLVIYLFSFAEFYYEHIHRIN